MGSENIKRFEIKLGRTGILIVIGGMALLLCVSFVIGVSVGKNIDTYPDKISSVPQRILAFFWRPAKVATEQNLAEEKKAAEKGNMDLAFHNTLTNSKTLPIQPPPPVEKAPEKEVVLEHKPAAAVPDLSKQDVVAKKEETPVRKDAASEKPAVDAPSKKKEESAASAGSGSYFIHVASVKEKQKAEQINKAVVDLGYKSKVVKTDIKGKGIWYRVIATGFETRAQAKTAVDKISKKVKTTCIIRQMSKNSDKN